MNNTIHLENMTLLGQPLFELTNQFVIVMKFGRTSWVSGKNKTDSNVKVES